MKAYVTASIRYTAKMVHKEDRSTVWSQVSVGKDTPLVLHDFLYAITASALLFYTDTAGCDMSTEELNDEIKALKSMISGLKIEDYVE